MALSPLTNLPDLSAACTVSDFKDEETPHGVNVSDVCKMPLKAKGGLA
jgi:hypothetical protein